MLNGLDLFSGIGGISLALEPWGRTVAYCENDRYAQSVLLSRMESGDIHTAPIWDDVTTLKGSMLPKVDIIFGGFPCQDISVAGRGVGLEGKRSGLFYEIIRISQEIKPTFLFLENVPAITGRGLETVIREITEIGYDVRWTCLSAAEVGANHRRDRWWLLGYSKHNGSHGSQERGSIEEAVFNNEEGKDEAREPERAGTSGVLSKSIVSESRRESERTRKSVRSAREESVPANATNLCENIPDTMRPGLQGQREESSGISEEQSNTLNRSWWDSEPSVGRVVNGLLYRVDRIKCLGNSVVPLQARTAFKELMGETK